MPMLSKLLALLGVIVLFQLIGMLAGMLVQLARGHAALEPLTWFKTVSYTHLDVYKRQGFDRDEAMMAKLGKHTTSKACLYIKRLSDIDMKVLEHLVKASVRAMASVRIRAR